MINLKTLIIPPPEVVPEPDEIDIRYVSSNINLQPPNKYDRVVCSLARHCLELKAATPVQLSTKLSWANHRIAELEAEVERLAGESLAAHVEVERLRILLARKAVLS